MFVTFRTVVFSWLSSLIRRIVSTRFIPCFHVITQSCSISLSKWQLWIFDPWWSEWMHGRDWYPLCIDIPEGVAKAWLEIDSYIEYSPVSLQSNSARLCDSSKWICQYRSAGCVSYEPLTRTGDVAHSVIMIILVATWNSRN